MNVLSVGKQRFRTTVRSTHAARGTTPHIRNKCSQVLNKCSMWVGGGGGQTGPCQQCSGCTRAVLCLVCTPPVTTPCQVSVLPKDKLRLGRASIHDLSRRFTDAPQTNQLGGSVNRRSRVGQGLMGSLPLSLYLSIHLSLSHLYLSLSTPLSLSLLGSGLGFRV